MNNTTIMRDLTSEKILSLPFMSSPVPLLVYCGVYLRFVLYDGEKFMKNRTPYNLTTFIRCYNVLQVMACTFFVTKLHFKGVRLDSAWSCIEGYLGDLGDDELVLGWWFIMLRAVEFVETVTFVLRKKYNQISFLHVYHHVSTLCLVWLFIRNAPAKMDLYISCINCYIHIIMYGYYFMSSFPQLNGITRHIKSFITMAQIMQLVIVLTNFYVTLKTNCHVTYLFYLQFANVTTLLILFTNFYIKAYLKKSAQKKVQ